MGLTCGAADPDASLAVVDNTLIEEEARASGKVSSKVYRAYMQSWGGGCYATVVLILYILSMVRWGYG